MALHSASHRTLLEIIQDKESELSHIRKAASVAAQEETRGIETQLFELKQDCSHHVKLLHDKDDVIQRLQDQLLQTEGENLRNIESIQRNCEELASIQITKETAKVEDEMRRRLQREYEDKLSRSKEDLEREYQSALVNQIQDQESLLYGIFDREIADREKEHTKQMNDIQRDMGIKDKERLELLYSSEQNYKKREASMLDEAKMRFESEARMKLEESECQWKAQMRSVEEEIEQDEKEMNRIGQDRSQLEVDNRELKYKIEELLSLIQQLQGEIGDNCEDFEIHKNKFKIGVKEWEDKCTLLDTLLKDEEENHRRQLHKVEKNSKSDRKALNRVMNKLKKDIVALKDEKDVAEELVKEKKDEMCTSRHQLKDKVASLRKDCHGLRMEIDSMHSKSLIDTRSKTRHKEDFALALEKKENAEQSIRRQIHFEHEAELERSTKQHMQKKLALVRERDDAIFDKDRLETKNREKDEEYGAMQSEVLIVQNRLRNDLRVMSTNNRNTQEQNSKLKETIKTMRKELETSMSSLMEEREQCITCSQRDPQKKEINLQTYEDRTSSRDNSVKLRKEIVNIDNLKQKLKNISADYDSLCIERDSLLDLSNKLRAEVCRLQYDESADKDALNNRSDISVENIDVDDLAVSVWASAISKQRRTTKSVKASDRATASQEIFRKKRVENNDPKMSTIRARKQNVRNWNRKYDEPKDPP